MSAPGRTAARAGHRRRQNLAETIAESLERRGHACTVATSGKAGRREARAGAVRRRPHRPADGRPRRAGDRREGAATLRPDAEVFVITGYGDVKTAVEAMKLGASHYLQKPIDLAELRAVVDKSAERRRHASATCAGRLDEKFGFEGVVGNSPKMQRVLQLLKAYAPTAASVLILGENGTGKELAARALHTNSPRKAKPFVAMNCAALNENLLDDEMFGHEDGAFTGAKGPRKGRFEYANGGTLFLDEVGDMPLPCRRSCCACWRTARSSASGRTTRSRWTCAIIAATNKDLETEVKAGKFRHDLYYRLKVGTVKLPPLRERREDIPQLGRRTSSRNSPRSTASRCRGWRRRCGRRSRATTGRATSASCGTCSTA